MISIGDLLLMEPGNKVGPTNSGIDDLIARDPNAHWDGQRVVTQPAPEPARGNHPLYDPVYYATGVQQGRNTDLKVANFLGFFIESRQRQQRLRAHHAGERRRESDWRARAGGSVSDSHSSRGVTMAQLAALLVSSDEEFRRDFGRLVRSGSVPIGIVDDRRGPEHVEPDLAFVDIRGDAAGGLGAIERLRAGHPGVSIFAIAQTTEPDLILQAMRAGANEFFMWPVPEEPFHAAVRRAAARRETSHSARTPALPDARVLRRQGRRRHHDRRGELRRSSSARLTKRPTLILDLKPCFGEVAPVPRHAPAVHGARRDRQPAPAGSRLPARAGREAQVGSRDPRRVRAGRPPVGGRRRRDRGAVPGARAGPTTTSIVDAGNAINSCTIGALYAADTLFVVVNPDVPSVRNAQRLIDRVRQLGIGGERVRVLLNRAGAPGVTRDPDRDGARVSGAPHVSERLRHGRPSALNSGVPLALSNHSEMAAQFGRFSRADRLAWRSAGGARPREDASRR